MTVRGIIKAKLTTHLTQDIKKINSDNPKHTLESGHAMVRYFEHSSSF